MTLSSWSRPREVTGAVDDDRVVIEVFAVDLDPNLLARIELECRRLRMTWIVARAVVRGHRLATRISILRGRGRRSGLVAQPTQDFPRVAVGREDGVEGVLDRAGGDDQREALVARLAARRERRQSQLVGKL